MKAMFITLLLVFPAAGCVTIPTSTTPITTQSGKPVPAERIYQRELTAPSSGHTAKVTFLRDAGSLGSYCAHKILVDGQVVFSINDGEYQTLYLAPGQHSLGWEIEGGICPKRDVRLQTDLSDGTEESYRILIATVAQGPLIRKIDATTKGKAPRDSYYAPLGNFELPIYSGYTRIQDKNDERGGIVSVLDDMGNNEGVTYLALPDNAEAIHNNPAKMDSAYRSFIYEFALPNLFQTVSAQSRIVHEEFLGSGLDRAFFAIVVIPEISSAMNAKTGKRWDSVRALLVFDKNKFTYMLHSEINTVLNPVNAASLTNQDIEAARKTMQRMRAAIRFH